MEDPFTNAYLLFALDLTRRMEAGELALEALGEVVRDLCAEGLTERAKRLGAYLDQPDPVRDRMLMRDVFERLADGGFEAYAAALARPAAGVVTTGHPTFALNEALSQVLVELATGHDGADKPLSAAGRAEREALARTTPHTPPADLSLDLEHRWSVRALTNALNALDEARHLALSVARERWPERWTTITPNLLTLATWVGFDQDGRTDVTWQISFGKRLQLKAEALARYAAAASGLAPDVEAMLARAIAAVDRQLAAFARCQTDPEGAAAFSRALIAEQGAALVDPAPLLAAIEAALANATTDDARETLVVLRAGLATQGICLAHIHVRLNAAQLHNAIRREVGLETSPSDPANRRSYFAAVNRLIEGARPVSVGFSSLLAEPTSAKRLFMTIHQMARYVDATAPVRFLIAETESGFTLLAALYFARLFGVEDIVELSPLFETAEALDRGEAVVDEAVKSPAFRAYLQAQGKLALEFGFSDSGRFIGQLAASFRIERLRFRLADLMARAGLTGLELIFFNTHGESIGRGGHPDSLADRLAYAAPPRDRAELVRRGIRAREEDSFQGGEGYLPFFTPTAARATVRGLLQFAFDPLSEADGDPIYDAHDFSAEFFATVQQAFSTLIAERDYATLLSLFGTRLLPKTGSRPVQRQSEGAARLRDFTHVSELRAIPNNAILQGLADLANSTFGIARAAAKDPHTFEAMRAGSPRFRRSMRMAEAAAALGELQATRAYAATVNPSLWLDRRRGHMVEDDAVLATLTRLSERAGITGALSRTLRHMRVEPRFPVPLEETPRRTRLRLIHGLRIALIQRIALLAARVPPFMPKEGLTREDVQVQLLRLDVKGALETLTTIFSALPRPLPADANFGEPAAYVPDEDHGYAAEHEVLFQPLERLHALLLETTAALNHEIGACG